MKNLQRPGNTGTLAADVLQKRLHVLTSAFGSDGRVGIGVQSASARADINGDKPFSLQSVMKLIVAAAAMDGIDRCGWRLNEPVLVRREDLSLNVQPLARLVRQSIRRGDKGYSTTLGDLIFRAVVDSDSAAADILFARVGGAAGIAAFLKRKGIQGVRVDRDERHLQTETAGLKWRPEYVDADLLARARAAVPEARREAAFRAYLEDVRDTATPDGMTRFLYRLATGRMLSAASTRHLLGVMRATVTFPDRLKAGVSAGWTLAHKTGTSGDWKGRNGATNDVGVLTAPDGGIIAVSVFIAGSRRPARQRAALMADVSRSIVAAYR